MATTAMPTTTDQRLQIGINHLNEERTDLLNLWDYYRGHQPMPYLPRIAKAEFRAIAAIATSAWLKLVADSITERLRVDGFQSEDDTKIDGSDAEAWRIWEANRMKAVQVQLYTESLVLGRSFVSVWPNADDPTTPTIRGESALRVWVARDSADCTPLWAVKQWTVRRDDCELPQGSQVAYLYDAETVTKFQCPDTSGRWEASDPIENPLGAVPFVEFPNNPDLLGLAMSEVAPLLPIQDRINAVNLNMQLAMLVAAFRQRWATGVSIPEDADGNPVEPFNAAVDRLWVTPNENAKFGDFGESNLANYVACLESLVRQLSAISQVPAHYLLGDMVNLSAEALQAAEAGLMSKVKTKQLVLGEAWSRVMDLVALAGGNVSVPLEPHWADTEARSEAQLVDALTKLATLGVPQEALWERYGVSPPTIARWQQMQDETAQRTAAAEVAGALTVRSVPDGDTGNDAG